MGKMKDMYCGAEKALEDLNRISGICKDGVDIGENGDALDAKSVRDSFQALGKQLDIDIAEIDRLLKFLQN